MPLIARITTRQPRHVSDQWQQYAQHCMQPSFDYRRSGNFLRQNIFVVRPSEEN